MINELLNRNTKRSALFCFTAVTALLAGCGGDSDPNGSGITTGKEKSVAIVETISADYQTGAHAVIGTTEPFTAEQELAETDTDPYLFTFGKSFFRIESFQRDSVTRFDIAAPAEPITQFSTLDPDEEGSSNPHALVFDSETKAYLLRYGKTKAWIVNPFATTQAEFKTGEIDLSEYDPGDGSVEMEAGVITDGKLFIMMQRFDSKFVAQDAYVAVIDTDTETEIDTLTDALYKGIRLPVKNPTDIQLDENGEIYINASGKLPGFGPAEYTGGIISLDSESYEVTLLLDDGDVDEHPYGNFSDMHIVAPDKAYFVSYENFQDTSLYEFNPITGIVNATPVKGLSGIDISGLAADSQKRLWVSISASEGQSAAVRVYDTADNTLVGEEIPMRLNPRKIVFSEIQAN